MQKNYKLYTTDNVFIKSTDVFPDNFTGMIEWPDGSKQWFVNGQRHRLDGPAVEYFDGTKHWWINDKRHRLDGPAIELYNGYREWYIGGEIIHCKTNEQFLLLVDIMKLKGSLK